MRSPAALLLLLPVLLLSPPAWSQSNVQAKIQPHLLPAGGTNPCSKTGSRPACAGIVTAGDLSPSLYYAYILVTDGNSNHGVAGLQFGLDYDGAPGSGIDVFGWTLCADGNITGSGWPNAGTGNLVTWIPGTNCQQIQPGGAGVVAVAGFVYLSAYSSDALKVIEHPAAGEAKVADCGAAESVIPESSLGIARFTSGATEPGFNPCQGLGGDPPLQCSINGPIEVPSNTTNSYRVSVQGLNQQVQWSISGNGSILGATNAFQVSVSAGIPGSYELTAQVTSSLGSGSCTKMVGVTQPTCAVAGPGFVQGGSLANYWVATGSSSGAYLWSIMGDGSIVGSTNGSTVQVQAGPAGGSFAISLRITSATSITSCSRTVNIVQGPACIVSGPDSVSQASHSTYWADSGPPPGGSYQWTISGNGSIVGSSIGMSVEVMAGSAGAFTISLSLNGSTCSYKTVTVLPSSGPTCTITGPGFVVEGTTTSHTAGNNPPPGSFLWTISGSGSIIGSSTSSLVEVQAGPAGSYRISLSINGVTNCLKDVTVTETPREGPNQQNAKILVHVATPTTETVCATRPPCNQVNTSGGLFPPNKYYAFVLVGDGNTTGALHSGVAGVQFGIQYDGASQAGVDVFSWTLCATLEFPSTGWPNSGGGNLITWDPTNDCQRFEPGGPHTGVVATVGYFYMAAYTADVLQIIPRPIDGAAKVANCFSAESIIAGSPSRFGQAAFGIGAVGYNPCGGFTRVERTTWSRIKTMTLN